MFVLRDRDLGGSSIFREDKRKPGWENSADFQIMTNEVSYH